MIKEFGSVVRAKFFLSHGFSAVMAMVFWASLVLCVSACQESAERAVPNLKRDAVTHVPQGPAQVQHILIAFEGSLPGKKVERSRLEAEKLAREIFEKAKKDPARFEDLVRSYSDDQVPGVYELVDYGMAPGANQFSRSSMVRGFGDESFRLKAGEIGLVFYDSKVSPFGFHIIKRLR
jgi:hypothetical protein